jgi:hypothetical protein
LVFHRRVQARESQADLICYDDRFAFAEGMVVDRNSVRFTGQAGQRDGVTGCESSSLLQTDLGLAQFDDGRYFHIREIGKAGPAT